MARRVPWAFSSRTRFVRIRVPRNGPGRIHEMRGCLRHRRDGRKDRPRGGGMTTLGWLDTSIA
jgi:hypothetical protein